MIYAIGDVHGERRKLEALLDMISIDHRNRGGPKRPRVVGLGDYGDRGPDSRGVYDLLSSDQFSEEFDATLIEGNHEDMLFEVERDISEGDLWLRFGGAEMVESYGFDFRRAPFKVLGEFFRAFPAKHRALIKGMSTWHMEDGYLFVHAGINPLRPDERDRRTLTTIREPFLSSRIDYGFTVVHGHSAGPDPVARPNRICVDTGCGIDPKAPLTAAILPGGGAAPLGFLQAR